MPRNDDRPRGIESTSSREPVSTNFPPTTRGHQFTSVSGYDNSRFHLGDVHQYTINPEKKPEELKSFGLCLATAPLIDPSHFVGRATELEQMHRILKPDTATEQQRLVLGGMGGIGKTQLAVAYARMYQKQYSSVIWLNATTEQALRASFRLVTSRLVSAQALEQLSEEQVFARALEWLSAPTNLSWLLIFDNYDDPGLYDIEEYYPYTAHGSVIITTRLPDRVAGTVFRLKTLQSIEEGLEILELRSGRQNLRTDEHARRLVERLDGLPLAIATTGAYLRRNKWSCEDYLHAYNERWRLNSRKPTELQEYRDRTFYTTWDFSYAQLKRDDPLAANVLKLMAYFDNQTISFQLLRRGMSRNSSTWIKEAFDTRISFENVMQSLVEYSLLEIGTQADVYMMHNCVHDWTLAELNRKIDLKLYSFAFDCVASSLKGVDFNNLDQLCYAPLSLHASRLMLPRFSNSLPEVLVGHRLRSTIGLGALTRQQQHFGEAEQLLTIALNKYETVYGDHHYMLGFVLRQLANTHSDLHQYRTAKQEYLRAIRIQRNSSNVDDCANVELCKASLGIMYVEQGNLVEAERVLRDLLSSRELRWGLENGLVFDARSLLADVYRRQGNIPKALPMFAKAAVGLERYYGKSDYRTLETFCDLAACHRQQGDYERAEEILKRILSTAMEKYGPTSNITLNVSCELTFVYLTRHQYIEVQQLSEQILQAVGNVDNLMVAEIKFHLSRAYFEQGRFKEAERACEQTLASHLRFDECGEESALQYQVFLAEIRIKLGNVSEAECMLEQALQLYEKNPPVNNYWQRRGQNLLRGIDTPTSPASYETNHPRRTNHRRTRRRANDTDSGRQSYKRWWNPLDYLRPPNRGAQSRLQQPR